MKPKELIIPKEEIIFRTRVNDLYREIYSVENSPPYILYSKTEDLKDFILTCENKMRFFKLSILNHYQDLIELFDNDFNEDFNEIFNNLDDCEKTELINVWYETYKFKNLDATKTLDAMKTLKYFSIPTPPDLLLKYSSHCNFNMHILKYIVEELKQDVNQQYPNDDTRTPVLIFSRKCELDAVIYLHQKGADILDEDNQGKNCISKLMEFLETNKITDEIIFKANKLFNYLYSNGCPYKYRGNITFKNEI